MATITRYVDWNTGNDSTGTGLTGAPWATVAHAVATISPTSGDTVNIRVRQTSGTKEDTLGTLTSGWSGVTVNIIPDVAGTTLNMKMTGGTFSALIVNTGTTTAATVTVQNLRMTNTSTSLAHFIFCSDVPAFSFVLEDCNIASSFPSTNTEIFTTGNAVTPTTNSPGFTTRRCTFTGFSDFVHAQWMGAIDIDDYTSFSPGATVTQTVQTFYLARFTSLKIRGGSSITRTDSQTVGILSATPRDCTQILIQDAVLDMSGATGAFPAAIQVEQFDANTPTNTTCAITITRSNVKVNGSGIEAVRLGQDDSLSLPKQRQAAAQVNRFGQVTVTDCDIINSATHGGGGILIGLGTDGQTPTATSGAVVSGNYFKNADPTDASAAGHCVVLAGDNITFRNNVSTGYLGIVNFGDYNVVTNNTCYCQSSCFLEGFTGGGSWSESKGSKVEDNIFIVLSSVVSASVYAVSDYAYNTRYVSPHTFTGRWNRNIIAAPNGCHLANINSTTCDTVAAMQAVWQAGWGTNPDNDLQSVSLAIAFDSTTVRGRYAFRPTTQSTLRSDGTYYGAVTPNPGVTLGATQSSNNTGQSTPLPTLAPVAAVSGTAPAASTPAIDGTLLEYAINYPVSQAFNVTSLDSTGWTQFVFTVKATANAADSAALITVVKTSPSAGSDGLTLLNGAAPSGSTSASDGSLTINETTPDTSATLTLTARGHALAASNNYVWELTRYSGGSGTKYQVGTGTWAALQSVRANPVAS